MLSLSGCHGFEGGRSLPDRTCFIVGESVVHLRPFLCHEVSFNLEQLTQQELVFVVYLPSSLLFLEALNRTVAFLWRFYGRN